MTAAKLVIGNWKIREFGARYVIVGHSERRAGHLETGGQIDIHRVAARTRSL
jgi:triosephosphate isomerase